jgi:heme oxygenase (biliverdin-IX-beta and delta-forming)
MAEADSVGPVAQLLRGETRGDHEAVDGAFGDFAIDDPAGYARFLSAHARILPLAERLIDPAALLADWEGRTAALLGDLAALGIPRPAEMAFALPAGDAARWGALYVMEGSRLGGAVLSRMVPAGLPAAYLGARHLAGGWRRVLAAIDAADEGPAWRDAALGGAKALFGAYLAAAAAERADG